MKLTRIFTILKIWKIPIFRFSKLENGISKCQFLLICLFRGTVLQLVVYCSVHQFQLLPRHDQARDRSLSDSCSDLYNRSCISGWIFQKVFTEIGQKCLIFSQKRLTSNCRNSGLPALRLMCFLSKDRKLEDLWFYSQKVFCSYSCTIAWFW